MSEHRAARELADAIVARDLDRAVSLLHAEIDFRAMTPNRFWEGRSPADVESTLREWFETPGEEIHDIAPTDPVLIEDTARVGWTVRISDAEGPAVFEQQAYVRERDGRIGWLRVMCSGWLPLDAEGI